MSSDPSLLSPSSTINQIKKVLQLIKSRIIAKSDPTRLGKKKKRHEIENAVKLGGGAYSNSLIEKGSEIKFFTNVELFA